MKKRAVHALAALVCLFTLLACLPACSTAQSSSLPLSPALSCIAENEAMAKSALSGDVIRFSADDFSRALNLSSLKQITLTSLPPVADGELRVGSSVLTAPQTLSAASLSLMTFHPSSDLTRSSFCFKANGSPVEMRCDMYVLNEKNYAPTLSVAPRNALEVSTHENVTHFGTLPCYDPDGDDTVIEIVSYPQKGFIEITDRQTGAYRYIPRENTTGKDSFTYVARDKYGNYSASATVSLRISKASVSTKYVDLEQSPYHNAALTMTEKGIMSGTQVGASTYFYPNSTLTRAEFTVMAMNAAGIGDVGSSTASTVFADNSEIPERMRGYVSAAYDLGYIRGSEIDGKLCFRPNDTLTRAEAAVMLAAILDAAAPTVTPVFEDSAALPTWAAPSVNALSALGVMNTLDGAKIEPLSAVTRGDAAQMLSALMECDKR